MGVGEEGGGWSNRGSEALALVRFTGETGLQPPSPEQSPYQLSRTCGV